MSKRVLGLPRRSFLVGGGGALAALAASPWLRAADGRREYTLRAAPEPIQLLGGDRPATKVWAFNGAVPGPELRMKQGEPVRVTVENGLPEGTTVHWHGLRVPNAMDGVPDVTQKLIGPGESFVYEFTPPDAGTYWYHPHQRSHVQVGRGLFGPLIVEDKEPIAVDRDLTWILNDWRLNNAAENIDDFGNFDDRFHDGRLGNTIALNGRRPSPFTVRAGERIRLRLINAAIARIFALRFEDHAPQIIAYDGQAVKPHAPEKDRVILAPSQRVDLIIDMTGRPGQSFAVTDNFYVALEKEPAYKLLDIAYGVAPPIRENLRDDPIALAPNPIPEPDIANAQQLPIVFGGGALAHGMIAGAMTGGIDWNINGRSMYEQDHGQKSEPIYTLARNRSYMFRMTNGTSFYHPIHLHGHSFRVVAREQRLTTLPEWRDSVVMAPGERVDIAFVADNTGEWMFHCHILDHQAFGMMASIRVT